MNDEFFKKLCVPEQESQIVTSATFDNSRFMNQLYKFKSYQQYCDITIKAGKEEKSISAHRLVLMAASDYFSAMLSTNMREATTSEINLKNFESKTVELLINYSYGQIIDINDNNVEDLLVIADHMQYKLLTNDCHYYLQKIMKAKTCIGIYLFAFQHNFIDLTDMAFNYIAQNIMDIDPIDFNILSFEQFSNILKRNDLNVATEKKMFELLLSWLHYDIDNRKEFFPKLLPLIKLALLEPQFLEERVETFLELFECKDTIIQIQKLMLNAYKMQLIGEKTVARSSELSPKYCTSLWAVCSNNNGQIVIEEYNNILNVWKYHKIYSIGNTVQDAMFKNYDTILFNDKLLIIGGEFHNKPTSTIREIDLKSKMMQNFHAALLTCRSKHCVAQLTTAFYCIGGIDQNHMLLSSVEKYSALSKSWSMVSSLKEPRCNASAVVVESKIYVFGGYTTNGAKATTVECYDSVSNEWTLLVEHNFRKTIQGVAAVPKQIMLITSETINNFEIEIYNNNLIQKSSVHNTKNKSTSSISTEVINEYLFSMNKNNPNVVMKYNTKAYKWEFSKISSNYEYGVLFSHNIDAASVDSIFSGFNINSNSNTRSTPTSNIFSVANLSSLHERPCFGSR